MRRHAAVWLCIALTLGAVSTGCGGTLTGPDGAPVEVTAQGRLDQAMGLAESALEEVVKQRRFNIQDRRAGLISQAELERRDRLLRPTITALQAATNDATLETVRGNVTEATIAAVEAAQEAARDALRRSHQ